MLTGTHDSTLVALSVLIATVASYTALDLAGRIRACSGWSCYAWLTTAAVAMGGGIWAMHFVAMLAFSLPGMEVGYDFRLTVISLIAPVFVTGIAFFVVNRKDTGVAALLLSGLFMGLGIVAMHYIGMAAMRMPADLSHDHLWIAVSLLIAIGASTVALWLAFRRTGLEMKLVAAVAMGLAISGMHYAAMQGAVFTSHGTVDGAQGHASIGQTALALAVAAATFLILFLALIAAMFDRRLTLLVEREAAALRRSEEQFRTLYKKTPLPLHSLDENGIIQHVSDAWLDLLDYSREEVVGRPISDFMTEDSAQRRTEGIWSRLLQEGELKDVEYRLVTKGGDVRDVLMSGKVVRDPEGRFGHVLGGIVDVTERKQAEEALRQAQKMEAIGQLTGGIAHDFNNLLMAVLGSLELLRKRLPDDPKVQQLLDNAMQAAQRGASLTQRMLAFARRQHLKPTAVDVPALIRDMADLLQRSIGPMVRIETRFPLQLPPALVDANQLELAILNLAVNARDAMPGGGTIIISVRQAKGSEAEGGVLTANADYVCLEVADTGEGMDEATLARAREPFFTTKGVGKGTGLGLSMVHGLAEQSNGRLVLKSRRGVGTTAEIWLPATQAGVAPPQPEAPSLALERPVRSLNVLVVDDDPLVLQNTAAMLDDLGHRAIEAPSGEAGLAVLRARSVDIVLTDQAMPGMTGLQLAEAIRREWAEVRVILATGYAELPVDVPPNIPRLSKPFTSQRLAEAISRAISASKEERKVVSFRSRHA